jgi:hypothetical protein
MLLVQGLVLLALGLRLVLVLALGPVLDYLDLLPFYSFTY